jgi:hypothetical protein
MRLRNITRLSFVALCVVGLVVAGCARATGEETAAPVETLAPAASSVAPPAGAATPQVDLTSIPAGTVIDASNIAKCGDVGGPSIRWIVEHGVKLKVGAYRKVTLPPPFREATEKYAGKVQLSADGKSLVDHVAGLPFPNIDTNDPQVAIKLMFDFDSAIARDDLDVRYIGCRLSTIGSGQEPIPENRRTFLYDHFRRLYYRERTTVEPLPEKPNPDGTRYKEGLYPVIEPFDLKGNGFVMNRYIDRTRQDDTWLYTPAIRRVRRMSSSQRSEPQFSQDIDMDSIGGFAGNLAWFDWKYLGEKTILATFHDATIPIEWGAAPGDYVHAATWEPRKV